MTDLSVHFVGPYSWRSHDGIASIFESTVAAEIGLYVWTIATPLGEFVYYVGETGRSFGKRMFEHLKEHLAGFYHVYDPVELVRGEKRELWPGMYYRGSRQRLPLLLDEYASLAKSIADLTLIYRFHLAPMVGDPRLRQRVEAALSIHLRLQDGLVGSFQDPGIRYRPRWDVERPLRVSFTSEHELAGLPPILEA